MTNLDDLHIPTVLSGATEQRNETEEPDGLTDLLHHALLEVPADEARLSEGVVLVTLGQRVDTDTAHLLLPRPLDSLAH